MTAARKLWTDEHQRQLRQARLSVGVSDVAFARDNAITLRHLQQLESGGSTAFYSDAIKYDMGVKLLRRLGLEPPATDSAQEVPAADVAEPLDSADEPDAAVQADLPRRVLPGMADKPIRWPAIVLSLVGVGLIGAGISWIPSIRPPGAAHGVIQAEVPVADQQAGSSSTVVPTVGTASSSPALAVRVGLPDQAAPSELALPATTLSASCDQAGAAQTIVPSQPSKSADYVYLTAISDVSLCVRDANGRITRKSLRAGQSFNIPGRQPFEVTADQLHQLRVFFQGQRIWFQADAPRLRLTAATASD
jgi:hypothetical protein